MQLTLKKSQATSGMLSKNAVFCLDARARLTAEENHAVVKYNLGKEIVYASDAAKAHAAVASAGGGLVKTMAAAAMAKLSLVITVGSLVNGQRIQCKDLAEILAAEQAIMEACNNIKAFLATAMTFDGREEVFEF